MIHLVRWLCEFVCWLCEFELGRAEVHYTTPLEGIVFRGLVFVGTFVWVNKAHQYYDEQ